MQGSPRMIDYEMQDELSGKELDNFSTKPEDSVYFLRKWKKENPFGFVIGYQ